MKYRLFILLLLVVAGCENERPLYEGEENNASGIYFQYAGKSLNGVPVWQDSIIYSFQNMLPDIKTYTLKIPVKLLGFVADYPRTYKAHVCGGTAVEGEDYQSFEPEYTFPAGQAETFLPVVLYRTEKLTSQSYSIEIELIENEYFKMLMPEIVSFSDTINATRFKVWFSEIITQPFYWLSAKSYFGDWSVKKIQFLNGIMGWTMQDWKDAGMQGAKITRGKFNYAAILMRNELQALADKGEPLCEDDGTFMQLGSSYQIDYSHYE